MKFPFEWMRKQFKFLLKIFWKTRFAQIVETGIYQNNFLENHLSLLIASGSGVWYLSLIFAIFNGGKGSFSRFLISDLSYSSFFFLISGERGSSSSSFSFKTGKCWIIFFYFSTLPWWRSFSGLSDYTLDVFLESVRSFPSLFLTKSPGDFRFKLLGLSGEGGSINTWEPLSSAMVKNLMEPLWICLSFKTFSIYLCCKWSDRRTSN